MHPPSPLRLARSAALHHRLATLLLTPDAPESEVVTRLISAETHIQLQHLRARQMTDSEERRLRDKEQWLTSAPLTISAGTQGSGTLVDSVDARTIANKHLRLVVIDSIATLGVAAREVVRAMAVLARDRNFALVVVTGVHEPADHVRKPEITDLRDYEAVVDLVDSVLLVERAEPPEVFIHVLKHRYSPTGSVRIALAQHSCAFSNLPEDS